MSAMKPNTLKMANPANKLVALFTHPRIIASLENKNKTKHDELWCERFIFNERTGSEINSYDTRTKASATFHTPLYIFHVSLNTLSVVSLFLSLMNS